MKKFGFDNLLVSDREIFDAIYSQKQKLTDDKLLELCKNHGIYVSVNETRETLCQYISTQFKDWYSLKTILDSLNHNEKNRKTATLLVSGANLDDFKEAIKDIAPQFGDNQMSHKGVGKSKYEVNLTTSSLEFSNTRLIQKPLTDQQITVETNGTDIVLRYDSEEVLEPIINKIVQKVAGTKRDTFKQKEISLSPIKLSEYRTNFFLNLIVLDDDRYLLHDVKRMKVHHNKQNTSLEITQEELSNEKEEKEDGFLKTAHLSGSSLHTNKLYQELKKLGHYITEITWTVIDTKENRLIEINAGFLEPKDCKKFFYDIKGYYKQNTKKTDFTLERHKMQDSEKSIFLKFFDAFLYKVYDQIIDEYENQLVKNDE
ncbi:hypothetical protein [Acinetobacter sp. 161(2023)]|uniref:hypothetical protein n=1 Tax=Acinetobacter sp. 161(2023) TaxID=3098768 RepID=UPI00300B9CBC